MPLRDRPLTMRALFVSLVLQVVAVQGDIHLVGEVDVPNPGVNERDFQQWEPNGVLGAMMAPRADPPGAVATEICGYLGGEINQPWVCAVGSLYCVVEPNEGVVGCCFSTYCGPFRTACYAQTAICDAACSKNSQNLICSSDKPICATYSYASHVTEVRCESTVPAQTNVAYTYSGFSTPILLPRIAEGFTIATQTAGFTYARLSTGTQLPPSSTAAPSSTASSTLPSSTTNPAASSSTSTSPAAGPTTSSSTPVGAIVGGVIGGLGLLLALAALVIWFRYKKRKAATAEPYPNMSYGPANTTEYYKADQRQANILSEAPGAPVNTYQHPQSPGYQSELPG